MGTSPLSPEDIVAILWAIAVAIAAFVYPVSHYGRKGRGVRRAGRQTP
jgi:hypothetical protein